MSARRRFRGHERGATLFVVVLAITLLTGVGLYSLHSSALVARASGNQREARQTTHLAELGTLIMLSDMGKNPEGFYKQVMTLMAKPSPPQCKNNLGAGTSSELTPFCYQADHADIVLPTGAAVMAADSFGPYADIAGTLNIEVTDKGPGPPVPGEQDGKFEFIQVKITTVAQLQRAGGGGACVANMMPIAGQHVTRAHVIMGPILMQ